MVIVAAAAASDAFVDKECTVRRRKASIPARSSDLNERC